jgi:hypothetical protein
MIIQAKTLRGCHLGQGRLGSEYLSQTGMSDAITSIMTYPSGTVASLEANSPVEIERDTFFPFVYCIVNARIEADIKMTLFAQKKQPKKKQQHQNNNNAAQRFVTQHVVYPHRDD